MGLITPPRLRFSSPQCHAWLAFTTCHELLLDISDNIVHDPLTLAGLRLVSSLFRSAADPAFFRTIILDGRTAASSALHLFQALSNRRYARHVRHFRADWNTNTASIDLVTVIRALVKCLGEMENVQVLRLAASSTANGIVEGFLAQPTTRWARLTDLRVQGVATTTFLQRHLDLKVVFVEGILRDSTIPLFLRHVEAIGFNEDGEVFFEAGRRLPDLRRIASYESYTPALHFAAEQALHICQLTMRAADLIAFAVNAVEKPLPFVLVHTLHLIDMDDVNTPDLSIPDIRVIHLMRHLFPSLVSLNILTHGIIIQSLRIATAILPFTAGRPRINPNLQEVRIDNLFAFVWNDFHGTYTTSEFAYNSRLVELEV